MGSVAAYLKKSSGGRLSSRAFAGELSCVGEARRFVGQTLEEANQGAGCDVAILLTSELATNVVLHARTSFEVVVHVNDEVIRVEIHDGLAISEAFRDCIEDPPVSVEPTAIGGRGMMLVGLIALRFGLQDRGTEGKAVWFELPISGAEDA